MPAFAVCLHKFINSTCKKITPLQVLFSGQLTDITGTGNISIENITDTDTLLSKLSAQFPLLKKYFLCYSGKQQNNFG